MKTSEDCFRAFCALKASAQDFDLSAQTEADTRVRLIDKIIHDCLDWPLTNVNREEHAHPGYMDYVLMTNRRIAVIEAKRSGDTFVLPRDISAARTFTVGGILRTIKNVKAHIDQVSQYCWHNGIEYAVITNGPQWVVFKALRTDGIHFSQGIALVFTSFDDIEARFVDFWSLLSKSQVDENSLPRAFQPSDTHIFQYRRVVDELKCRDERVTRNDLSRDLEPLISEYLGEIAGEGSADKLRDLYVKNRAIDEVLEAVEQRINTSLSATVAHAARTQGTGVIADMESAMQKTLKNSLALPPKPEILLLLGRVGSGKTTFVSHFLRIDLKSALDHHIVAAFDFRLLEPGADLRRFFYAHLEHVLAKSKAFTSLTPAQLRKVYAPEIRMLTAGPLAVLERSNKPKYEEKIADFLLDKYRDLETHLTKTLKYLAEREGIRTLLFFDNVDQLDFKLQQQVFAFANSAAAACLAITILPMWEETFLRSSRSGALKTYQIPPAYLLPPTSVVDILNRRLDYVIDDITRQGIAWKLLPEQSRSQDVRDFLGLVRKSLLHDSKRVRFLLEALAMGDRRKAMKIFEAFLLSGHTDAGKMLAVVRRERNQYLIPMHEFVKSIGLGDQRLYQSDLSFILNLFTISDETRPSHFTKLRIVNYLYYNRNRTTSFGVGFIQTSMLKRELTRIGVSDADFNESLKTLTIHSLVENDTYDAKELGKAYRITPAGRFYSRGLAGKFAYLDLVLHDTPIADNQALDVLHALAGSTDVEERLGRVETFVDYLENEEEREFAAILHTTDSLPLRNRIMPSVRRDFVADREYIRRRIAERRQVEKSAPATPYRPSCD